MQQIIMYEIKTMANRDSNNWMIIDCIAFYQSFSFFGNSKNL